MRKKLLFISVFLLVVTAIVALSKENGPSVLVAGEKKINSIKAKTRPLEKDFRLFFDGEELPYDEASRTFYLPVDMEDEEWEIGQFAGTFYDEGNADEGDSDSRENVKGQQADLLFVESYKKADKQEAIAEGKGFSFLAVTKEGYGEYQLVFTGLPMITFTGTEYLAEDGTQMFLLKVYDTDHEGSWVTECYTQSRLRGNTSLTYEKKSLRLYLKELNKDGTFEKCNENLLGLRDDDDWILNALYADNTRIRDQLCIDLWNEVGAGNNPYGQNFGTQSAMVEVIIGNGYQGIYDLMVPIDRKQLGMDAVSDQIAGGETIVERLYKKKYTASWNASDFVGPLPDANQIDYRGGFYLKGDTVLQNEEEWLPLYQVASLLEADDETFAAEITGIADRQNLVDNWLFYQAIAGFDNENKNMYYVARNRGDSYYGYFIPWDMNLSFGAVYAENVYYCEESAAVIAEPVLWQPGQRMIELDADGSKELASATWQKWRSGAFSDEALLERISGLEHQVKDSGAFAREDARWQNGNQNEDFSFLYDFAITRMKVVDAYISGLTGIPVDNGQEKPLVEEAPILEE
ncbi:MAG: CotH kinase family protein [Lachnospiraceae bacterium]|nr:CotH kinase family protein [Lachnospiraceae bacterium]